ncbi:MAG: hypothetical protein ACK4NA_12745 [Alphaproteobacteria bacterium]
MSGSPAYLPPCCSFPGCGAPATCIVELRVPWAASPHFIAAPMTLLAPLAVCDAHLTKVEPADLLNDWSRAEFRKMAGTREPAFAHASIMPVSFKSEKARRWLAEFGVKA